MKTLELELKNKVLIVQPEETGNMYSWIKMYSDNWDFKCLGSEFTEEIASELAEEHYMSGIRSYEIYNDYRYNDARWLDNAIESFISAVESKGFYWLKNPIKYKKTDYEIYADKNQLCRYISKEETLWEEAEEKTFKNPLIFVKK